jgi:hypothetical protein
MTNPDIKFITTQVMWAPLREVSSFVPKYNTSYSSIWSVRNILYLETGEVLVWTISKFYYMDKSSFLLFTLYYLITEGAPVIKVPSSLTLPRIITMQVLLKLWVSKSHGMINLCSSHKRERCDNKKFTRKKPKDKLQQSVPRKKNEYNLHKSCILFSFLGQQHCSEESSTTDEHFITSSKE